jgi:hypothetical protein
VPLLTFIGDIDLDKSLENEYVIEKNKEKRNKPTAKKRKKGFRP